MVLTYVANRMWEVRRIECVNQVCLDRETINLTMICCFSDFISQKQSGLDHLGGWSRWLDMENKSCVISKHVESAI